MGFLLILKWFVIVVAAGAFFGFFVLGPVVMIIGWLYSERQEAKRQGTPQYYARMDKEARKKAAFERWNTMQNTSYNSYGNYGNQHSYGGYTQPPFYTQPLSLTPQQWSAYGFKDRLSLLDDLLVALGEVTKWRVFGEKKAMVRNTLLTREQVIEATRTNLLDLLNLVESVFNDLLSWSNEAAAAQYENQRLSSEMMTLKGQLWGATSHQAYLNKRNNELQSQVDAVRQGAQSDLSASVREKSRLRDQLQTAQSEVERLKKRIQNEQSQALSENQSLKEQIATLEGLLVEAQIQIKELEKFTAFLRQDALTVVKVASFKDYMSKLKDATEAGEPGIQPIPVKSGYYVDTLFYSFKTNLVAVSLEKIGEYIKDLEKAGGTAVAKKKRALPAEILKEMLSSFSGVLGYYNLFLYLRQLKPGHKDLAFLQALLNLSIIPSAVEIEAAKIDAASLWLEEHLPPIGTAPNPCCFTPTREAGRTFTEDFKKYRSDYWMSRFRSSNNPEYWLSVGRDIAKEIIATEVSNLLDFRNSLYVVVDSLAPLPLEEQKGTEPEELFVPEEPEQPRQAVKPKVSLLNDEHPTRGDIRGHVYTIQINEPRLSQPITFTVGFNDNGVPVEPREEET